MMWRTKNVYGQQINKQKNCHRRKIYEKRSSMEIIRQVCQFMVLKNWLGAFYTVFFIIFLNIGGIGYYYLWLF